MLPPRLLYAGASALLGGTFAALPKAAGARAARSGRPQDRVPLPVTAWWLAAGFALASAALAAALPQRASWAAALGGAGWAAMVLTRVASYEQCGLATGCATPDATALLVAWALAPAGAGACAPLAAVAPALLLGCLASLHVLEAQGRLQHLLLRQLRAGGGPAPHAAPDGAAPAAAAAEEEEEEEPLQAVERSAGTAHWYRAAGDLARLVRGSGSACSQQQPLLRKDGEAPQQQQQQDDNAEQGWGRGAGGDGASAPAPPACGEGAARPPALAGLACGVASGVFAGLSQLAPVGRGGLDSLLCSALGMLACASLAVAAHHAWLVQRGAPPPGALGLHARRMGPLGAAGGALLCAALACGAGARGTAGADAAAAVVRRASLLVSGAWGVGLFRELRSGLQLLFWAACAQVLAAAAVLAVAPRAAC
ncbi:hypothetical protein HT031_000870 [Scenedesmus sp. PABB004]|nr:hypothetical protein HT031_000870 [Scenedesmus sp. PABB004]